VSLLPNYSDYIIFVDESGSPTLTSIDAQYPLFVLVFCIVEKIAYAEHIQPAIKKLKFEFFGHDMTVLHANDIRKPTSSEFKFLLNPQRRSYFMNRLNGLLDVAPFHIITHVIHKKRLIEKYQTPFDPYHIALRMCLEQTSLFLKEHGQAGKLTHIISESRGSKEDRDLELEFRRILDPNYNWGMASKFAIHDTPFELKFAEKKINSAGLQLADLAGQPIGRNALNPTQPNQAFDIIEKKVWRKIWHFP
jgi:hypothetical protein